MVRRDESAALEALPKSGPAPSTSQTAVSGVDVARQKQRQSISESMRRVSRVSHHVPVTV